VPAEAERWAAESTGGDPPPQSPHQQAPYPARPAFSSGTGITAKILCTVSSLSLVFSAVQVVLGVPPFGSYSDLPPWATLDNGVWSIGDILVIVGTILMWRSASVGRILAVTGLSMAMAGMLGFELVAFSRPGIVVQPWVYPIFLFLLLSLAFVLLPDTSRHSNADRPLYAPASPHRKAARPPIKPPSARELPHGESSDQPLRNPTR